MRGKSVHIILILTMTLMMQASWPALTFAEEAGTEAESPGVAMQQEEMADPGSETRILLPSGGEKIMDSDSSDMREEKRTEEEFPSGTVTTDPPAESGETEKAEEAKESVEEKEAGEPGEAEEAEKTEGTEEGTAGASQPEPPSASAGITIQLRTGMPGSENDETVAEYSLEELAGRSYWEDDYSFIDPEYGVVIEHARGVALRELLDEAGIDPDTAEELIFITGEARLTLPAADLLRTDRYCYFSLPDHYEDGSYLTDPAVSLFRQKVDTILAVEDHWVTASGGGTFWSSPADMTGENAVRLVIGQESISEIRAEASLSRIHTILVVIDPPLMAEPEPDGAADTELSGEQTGPADRETDPQEPEKLTDKDFTPQETLKSSSGPKQDDAVPAGTEAGSSARKKETERLSSTVALPAKEPDGITAPEERFKDRLIPSEQKISLLQNPETAIQDRKPDQLKNDTPLKPLEKESAAAVPEEPEPLLPEPSPNAGDTCKLLDEAPAPGRTEQELSLKDTAVPDPEDQPARPGKNNAASSVDTVTQRNRPSAVDNTRTPGTSVKVMEVTFGQSSRTLEPDLGRLSTEPGNKTGSEPSSSQESAERPESSSSDSQPSVEGSSGGSIPQYRIYEVKVKEPDAAWQGTVPSYDLMDCLKLLLVLCVPATILICLYYRKVI